MGNICFVTSQKQFYMHSNKCLFDIWQEKSYRDVLQISKHPKKYVFYVNADISELYMCD